MKLLKITAGSYFLMDLELNLALIQEVMHASVCQR
jgi:hypothetical protein